MQPESHQPKPAPSPPTIDAAGTPNHATTAAAGTPAHAGTAVAGATRTAKREEMEAVAEQVFVALADPSRRSILAALASGGPATATDLANRLPITRQAIAKHLTLLTDAGLVIPEHGERRRVRFRLHSAPMQVAQQFLAAMARDWDTRLDALKQHLDR
jgi:DNA-binding transcriptional ArsR family regulator